MIIRRDDEWCYIYTVLNKIEPNRLSGSVLYLGMGTCYIPSLQSDKVTTTHILELEQEVIDYNKDINPSWKVIKCDAYTYEPEQKYDFIFIDIFYHRTTKEIMECLIDRYLDALNVDGKIFYLHTVCKEVDKSKYMGHLAFQT
jgi:hypothetical protein